MIIILKMRIRHIPSLPTVYFCTDLTVCAGYSQAFEMMCNGSGIDAVAVTSYYHEWNKVRLNDSWYNVDCTWDDADGTIYYGYFERSDNYYDTVNYSSYVFHAEEDIWEGYLPACTIDSGATSSTGNDCHNHSDSCKAGHFSVGKRYLL